MGFPSPKSNEDPDGTWTPHSSESRSTYLTGQDPCGLGKTSTVRPSFGHRSPGETVSSNTYCVLLWLGSTVWVSGLRGFLVHTLPWPGRKCSTSVRHLSTREPVKWRKDERFESLKRVRRPVREG